MRTFRPTLFLLAGIILLSSSCHSRGEYICTCKGGLLSSYHQEVEVPGKNKKDARAKCKALGDEPGIPDGISCELGK
jgi:hypothetical protein